MKTFRLAFVLALFGAAACSSPTEPRLPQPDPGRDKEPDRPGISAFAPELSADVSFARWG